MKLAGFKPAKSSTISQILSKDYKLKYKREHKVQKHTNSERSLVLRHRFARCMLGLLKAKKRILIIDETVLGESNFLRRSWQGAAYSVSVPAIKIAPRLSMITAIDTEGEVYWSVL